MPSDRLDAAQSIATAGPAPTAHTNRQRRATTQRSNLPQQLQNAVPSCARQCLAEYVEQGWTCSDDTAGCLCRQYTSQGFTLGELAYICLQQDCEQSTYDDLVAAYQICSAHEGAATATHSTLTVPAKTTAPTGLASSPLGLGTSIKSSGTLQRPPTSSWATTSRTTSAPDTFESATPADVASSALMTSFPSAAAAGAVSSPNNATSLTTAQAIGISVASMGVVVVAIGIFYLVTCLRRRNVKVRDEKQERDSYDFVDEAPPRFSPFHYGYADPRGPLGGFYGQRAELTSEKRNSKWYRDQFLAEPVPKYEKGFDHSPKSVQSRSTMSQLLPEIPKATPPQMRAKQSPRPWSTRTAPTVFEEDRSPLMHSSMFPPPVGLPANPKAFHQPKVARPQQAKYRHQLTQSPVSTRQPSLSIEIPKQAARVIKSPAQAHLPAPHLRQRSPVEREQRTSDARSSKSAGSFLSYYASPEADTLRSPDSPTPIDDDIQKRRPVPTAITVTKPTYPPRAVRVTSGASDTSFESTDPDEPTPPDEADKQLTPVKEHSPIAGIKYPKVPRSSNQAIPRSPPIGLKTSPSIGARIVPSPKQVRRSNALPVGAHTRSSPQEIQRPAQTAQAQEPAKPRPTSQIQRKPLPSHPPGPDPATPERRLDHNSNLSGSTLAAKRRGDDAAHSLERQLHIKDSFHPHSTGGKESTPPSLPARRRSPHNSPLKGYGRVASRNNSPVATRLPGFPQVPTPASRTNAAKPTGTGHRKPGVSAVPPQPGEPLKSPHWEPKLTPSRNGEDMYLQVGSATPRTEAFGRDTSYKGH